ncbi:hypothetical protein FRC10_011992 [Ceratobasidium sp. 414]|nr:hypothetical protein FRC10_011992 [Ceratobasidium sp. 414]
MPWLQASSLFDVDRCKSFEGIIAQLEVTQGEESDAEGEDDAEDAVAEFWAVPQFLITDPVDVVLKVVSHLDTNLARKWFEPWFKNQFSLGCGKCNQKQ